MSHINRWLLRLEPILHLPHNRLQQIIIAMTTQENIFEGIDGLQQKLFVALKASIQDAESKIPSVQTESILSSSSPFVVSGGGYSVTRPNFLYSLKQDSSGVKTPEKHSHQLDNLLEKVQIDDTLAVDGLDTEEGQESASCLEAERLSTAKPFISTQLTTINSGGSMADLSGYKDLSKAPVTFGDEEDLSVPVLSAPERKVESRQTSSMMTPQQHFGQQEMPSQDSESEFSGNVKTLIRLVNELPEGVTKQTGAQIIRLTMEAMGISMEDVLSEAQSAQSEMLDAVRANIKKIEEYKTVIRKLETDIKFYQGKANELSEIIDLFILSNTSGNKTSQSEDD